MTLKLRNGIWHFRKMINGQQVARSTKTGDKKLAEQFALKIEHEFVKSVVIQGVKSVRLHEAIKAFLSARKGTGGFVSATTHMKHWQTLASLEASPSVWPHEFNARYMNDDQGNQRRSATS